MKEAKPRIYCDTCVYIDRFCHRRGRDGRNLEKEADLLFTHVLKGEYTLLVSNFVLEELKAPRSEKFQDFNYQEFQNLELLLTPHMEYIKYNTSDKEMAMKRKPDNWKDALHVTIAEKSNADYLVTQNLKDYVLINTKIKVVPPLYLC